MLWNESHAVGKFSIMITFACLRTKTAQLLCVCIQCPYFK